MLTMIHQFHNILLPFLTANVTFRDSNRRPSIMVFMTM